MPLAAGTRLGPYEVLGLIGSGGMGEVYRARDSRLERDVALKVLPAGAMTDETARTRLVREARLASQLNHPDICKVYEVGEADRQVFIAMELVEGRALSARLADGPLPIDQVLRYGHQMADALAHAHSRGVVHRDFKSANVIITPEEQVKVLDFGLAKRLTGEELADVATATQQTLTAPGMVAGTLAYMAPERLRGHPADERSDIWALGVVLHEMATGQRPFLGQTGFELAAAILSQVALPVPASVPAPLASVVARCREKEPRERYQQSSSVRAALEAVASGQAGKAWPTWRVVLQRRRGLLLSAAGGALALLVIAAVLLGLDVGGLRSLMAGGAVTPARAIRLVVLPFANLSADPDQEYLSDGLTQDVITQLGGLHPAGLEVIARTSVMRYKKRNTPVNQVGRELRVEYVLDGSVQREGSRIRIAAALIKIAGETKLWADTYERELAGILALQSEVARNVARALALKLLPAEHARLANARAVIPEAYDAYQKGTYHWQKLTREDLDTAERYFGLAIEKDPSYAPAHEGLAWVWSARQAVFTATPQEAGPKATAAALHAIALDDTSAGAHEALATVKTWTDWDWSGAEAEWRRTLEIDPARANAHAYYALFLTVIGRTEEALQHSRRSIELDPFNVLFHGFHARNLCAARRYDDAITAARNALSMQPDVAGPAARALECAFIAKGMYEEHLALQRERIAKDPERLAALEQGFAEAGYQGAMRRVADLLAARYKQSGGVPNPKAPGLASQPPAIIATWYAHGGDYGRAIDWLEKSFQVGIGDASIASDPRWDPVRSDPRFQALIRRLRLPQ